MYSADNPPKVAVVGSGHWGRNLIRNHRALGSLALLCDRNETALARFERQVPDVETCLAFSDVLARRDIDGVVLATPAETHFRLAREALLADRHVYVEKPLALDEDEGSELVELARERSRVLMVGHLLQYHPAFVRLKELARSGALGRINYVYSNRLNLGKIRREENILWSFAPHDISMILSLAGEPPESVWATGGCYLHKRIADVTTTHMEFPSGLRAHIFVSWLHPYQEQRLVVVGDRKMAVFDDTRPWPDKLLLYEHRIRWQDNQPVPVKGEPEQVPLTEDEPLRLACMHFLECMSAGKRPLTDGAEGVEVLRVLRRAQAALDGAGGGDAPRRPGPEQEARPDRDATPAYTAHPTAVIDPGCEIGAGTRIWHFSHVLSGARIGEQCNIGQNVVVGNGVRIGRGCKVQNNVTFAKGATLEDAVFCGPSVIFTNIHNPRAEFPKMDQVRPTLVRHGATLGGNCILICGVTVGRYAFVGAGAVVTRDVPDFALVVGNPARRIGWACRCGQRLDEDLACPACGARYENEGQGIRQRS